MNANRSFEALRQLKMLVDSALQYEHFPDGLKDQSDAEILEFQREHPGAWLVLGGEFEIKCLCPEKYGLNL